MTLADRGRSLKERTCAQDKLPEQLKKHVGHRTSKRLEVSGNHAWGDWEGPFNVRRSRVPKCCSPGSYCKVVGQVRSQEW